MANNKVQAQEIESLNIREAFFMKNKKAIIIAVVAIVVIIAGVFGYVSQISGPREDKASTMLGKGQTTSTTRCSNKHLTETVLVMLASRKLQTNIAALTLVTWQTSMQVFAMPTLANGQKQKRVWMHSLQRMTR